MKLVNRGLALFLALALAFPTLPVYANGLENGGKTDTTAQTEVVDEDDNDELADQSDLTPPGGGDDTTPPGDGGDDPTPPGDGGDDPTPPGDGGDDPTPPGDGGDDTLPGDEGDDTPPGDGGDDDADDDADSDADADDDVDDDMDDEEERIIPDRAAEVKFNTGNYEFSIVDYAVTEDMIGDGAFDENGNFTINIPEANPFFPYEVQFTCNGEVTTEWFMTPDDSVEIGGHTFYVSAYMDGTAVTQLTLKVAGKDVIVYPARKEFTNANGGIMPTSLLPLTERWLSEVDLTGYTPAELTQVSVSSVLGNNISNGQDVVWGLRGDNGEYAISSYGDKVDLSVNTYYGSTNYWEMIVGSADQLDSSNTRYFVPIRVTPSENWLTFEAYVQDSNGNRKEIWVGENRYQDYDKDDRLGWLTANVPNLTSSNISSIYFSMDINDEVYTTPRFSSFKVFEGKYNNVGEIGSARDITSLICNRDMSRENAGYPFVSYEAQPMTIVTYDVSGNVTGCLPLSFRFSVGGTAAGVSGIYKEMGTERKNVYVNSRTSISNGIMKHDMNLYKGEPANGQYYVRTTLYSGGTTINDKITAVYTGHHASIAAAQSANAEEIKDKLFGNEGYLADYSNGVNVTVFVGADGDPNQEIQKYCFKTIASDIERPTQTPPSSNLNSGTVVNFTGLKSANGTELPVYITEMEHDSYGEYNFITMLVDSSVDLTQALAPVFDFSWSSEGAKLYAKGSSTAEVSGESKHVFGEEPLQYTCSSQDGKNSRNYWLKIIKAEAGSKLYINSLEDAASNTREENGVIHSTREVMLDGYHDYVHDILVLNKGMESIPKLSVELNSDVLEMDEYWTLKGVHDLAGFLAIQQNTELSNQAKIRLKAKEGVDAKEVSGTLTIKSDGTPLVVLNLTGIIGDPSITTESIPTAVKYVPYGTMIQNNNKYSWNTVSYRLYSGKLPKGMEIMPNGELYGVPQETGSFSFTVRMENSSYDFEDCTKSFTLEVMENTDANVDNATDTGYGLSEKVQNIHVGINGVNGQQTLVSEGEFVEFKVLYLDGVELKSGKDYTAEAGSTRITILNQTLVNSGKGTHTLGIEFRTSDGENVLKRAAQNYVVTVDAGYTGNTPGNIPGNNTDTGNSSDNNSWHEMESSNNATVNKFDKLASELKQKAEENQAGKTITETITYTIQPGDTLWKIAAKYFGDGNQWRKILEDNKATIKNPNRIYVGQVIIINVISNGTGADTSAANATASESLVNAENGTYTVQTGDTMWKISKKLYGTGIFWRRLFNANKDTITDASRIYVGQTIKIPD